MVRLYNSNNFKHLLKCPMHPKQASIAIATTQDDVDAAAA